jgi:hypothetical protein
MRVSPLRRKGAPPVEMKRFVGTAKRKPQLQDVDTVVRLGPGWFEID